VGAIEMSLPFLWVRRIHRGPAETRSSRPSCAL